MVESHWTVWLTRSPSVKVVVPTPTVKSRSPVRLGGATPIDGCRLPAPRATFEQLPPWVGVKSKLLLMGALLHSRASMPKIELAEALGGACASTWMWTTEPSVRPVMVSPVWYTVELAPTVAVVVTGGFGVSAEAVWLSKGMLSAASITIAEIAESNRSGVKR